jgi:undecaprenyl-diphosphatase
VPPESKHDYSVSRGRIDATIAAGLLLAVVILVFFGWLARAVLAGSTREFDAAVRAAVHAHASVPLTRAMRGITLLGDGVVLAPAGIALVCVWLRRRRRTAALFAVTMTGAILLDLTLKQAFHRPRPEPFFDTAVPLSWSFPSGHALISFCFWFGLAALAGRRRPAAWLAAAAIVLPIGFSRIYLGVHYPSDVIAGYSAAAVWVLTVASGYRLLCVTYRRGN